MSITVVDFSGICFSLMYSIGRHNLSHNDLDTGIIYSFLRQLYFYNNKTKSDTMVIACDSKGSYRKQIYPSYKEKRGKAKKEKTKEEQALYQSTLNQMSMLRKQILPFIGFNNIFIAGGYEADDIMARLVYGYSETQFTLITNDKDMYQLLGSNCKIFNHRTKQFYTKETLWAEWGCTPTQWAEARCIGGCSTDEVDGVSGVKEKTAIKYIHGMMNPGKTLDKITSPEGLAICERNRPLVTLPYKGTPNFLIVPNEFSQKKLAVVCKKLGFDSILQTIRDWNLK